MQASKIELYPLKVLLGFLVFTEVLFFVGPIDFKLSNGFGLMVYLVIVNVALWLGYKKGVKSFQPSTFTMSSKTIDLIIIAGLVLEFMSLVSMWGQNGITVSYTSLLNSILNPGEAYYSESGEDVETSIIGLLLSPLSFASIPLGIATWKKRPAFIKYIILFIIMLSFAKWLGVGKRKGLLDTIVIISFCLLACKQSLIQDSRLHKKMKYVVMALIVLFLSYFIVSNLSRGGNDSLAEAIINASFLDCKEVYLKYLPPAVTLVFVSIASYLCQGYYALGLGLSYGILPTATLGSSWFTIAIARKLGYNPVPDTYMMLLEQKNNIGMSMNWHTAYLWLANDFTFIGVPVFVFLIGYFWAQSWCDSIHGRNVLSFPVMSLFSIMVFYFFANNQVFSFSFVPFIVLFTFYLLSRRNPSNKHVVNI